MLTTHYPSSCGVTVEQKRSELAAVRDLQKQMRRERNAKALAMQQADHACRDELVHLQGVVVAHPFLSAVLDIFCSVVLF